MMCLPCLVSSFVKALSHTVNMGPTSIGHALKLYYWKQSIAFIIKCTDNYIKIL